MQPMAPHAIIEILKRSIIRTALNGVLLLHRMSANLCTIGAEGNVYYNRPEKKLCGCRLRKDDLE